MSAVQLRWMQLLAVAFMGGSPALAVAQLPPPDQLITQPRPPLRSIGPVDFHPRAQAAIIYDDNISLYEERGAASGGIQVGRTQPPLGDDLIYVFSPGVRFVKPTTLEDSRTALSVDYSPSFVFFQENTAENSVDHTAKFEAGYAFTKLTLGLAQDFVSTAGGVVDVGNRVSQQNYRTALNARYELTQKTFLRSSASYRLTDYERLSDSEEWNADLTANYQITAKVTLGLGAHVGQLFVTDQAYSLEPMVRTNEFGAPIRTNFVLRTTERDRSQTYAGPVLRAHYRTTEKTDVSLTVGADWRSYSEGGTSFDPVFSVAGGYRPWEGTAFTLEGHRREQNSAVITGANYISTGVSAGVRQRLHDRLTAHVQAGYNHLDYKATGRSAAVSRDDDYLLLRYGVDAILGRSWTIGVFHQYRDNNSSDERFTFSNNQVGIQGTWVY